MIAFLHCIAPNTISRRRPTLYLIDQIVALPQSIIFIGAFVLSNYPTAAKADDGGAAAGALFLFLLFIGLLLLYLLPTIIAFRNGHPNRWVILALNVFLGSTIIVWVICLIWANKAIHLSADAQRIGGTDGGEVRSQYLC